MKGLRNTLEKDHPRMTQSIDENHEGNPRESVNSSDSNLFVGDGE